MLGEHSTTGPYVYDFSEDFKSRPRIEIGPLIFLTSVGFPSVGLFSVLDFGFSRQGLSV